MVFRYYAMKWAPVEGFSPPPSHLHLQNPAPHNTAIQQGDNKKPYVGLNSGENGILGRGDERENMMDGQRRPETLCPHLEEDGSPTPNTRAWEMLKGPEKSP